jgi:hypothetical protein
MPLCLEQGQGYFAWGGGAEKFPGHNFFLEVTSFAELFRFHLYVERTCTDFCILGSTESGWKSV